METCLDFIWVLLKVRYFGIYFGEIWGVRLTLRLANKPSMGFCRDWFGFWGIYHMGIWCYIVENFDFLFNCMLCSLNSWSLDLWNWFGITSDYVNHRNYRDYWFNLCWLVPTFCFSEAIGWYSFEKFQRSNFCSV